MIDDKVVIQGARGSAGMLIEHRVEITDDAVIEALPGEHSPARRKGD
jgi:hypothetical protein